MKDVRFRLILRRTLSLTYGLCLLMAALLSTNHAQEESSPRKTLHLSGETMGTSYTVTCVVCDAGLEAVLHEAIRTLLEEINGELSNWKPESWVSRFNRNEGSEPVSVPPHALEALRMALLLAKRTDGVFDPTISPLIDLWGFGSVKARTDIPTPLEIQDALSRCGYQKLVFEAGKLAKRDPDIQLNLSAVREGLAADAIAACLDREDVQGYLIDVGGKIRSRGTRMDGKPWQVEIARPNPGKVNSPLLPNIVLRDDSLSTSGIYVHYFERNGRRYSHLLDPRTGEPIDNGLLSVTVRSPSCLLANGLSAASCILGAKAGMELIESFPQVGALFLGEGKDGKMVVLKSSRWIESGVEK